MILPRKRARNERNPDIEYSPFSTALSGERVAATISSLSGETGGCPPCTSFSRQSRNHFGYYFNSLPGGKTLYVNKYSPGNQGCTQLQAKGPIFAETGRFFPEPGEGFRPAFLVVAQISSSLMIPSFKAKRAISVRFFSSSFLRMLVT